MIFTTRQDPQVLHTLQNTGIYTVEEEYIRRKYTTITDHYASLYRRLTSYARGRTAIPDGVLYPVWLTLGGADALPPSEDSVYLRLDIPDGHYLLASNDVWEHMINHLYYPSGEADELVHEAELARYGIVSPSSLIDGSAGNFYPLLRQKVELSWQQIYDLPYNDPNQVSGLCWELHSEWLI